MPYPGVQDRDRLSRAALDELDIAGHAGQGFLSPRGERGSLRGGSLRERVSMRGGSEMGGSRSGSRAAEQRAQRAWRTVSEYSDEVIVPSFWGAVTTIYERTSAAWNGGFGFVCNAVGFLFGGSITIFFALFCLLNLLNKMSVLAFLASFLSEEVLEAFAMNANMTAICRKNSM